MLKSIGNCHRLQALVPLLLLLLLLLSFGYISLTLFVCKHTAVTVALLGTLGDPWLIQKNLKDGS